MAMTPDAIRGAVRAYYAAVRGGDIDVIAPLFAADAVMRDPVGAPPATDDAQRRQRYAGIGAMFERFAIDEDYISANGDEAAARWIATGHSRSGRDISFDGISTFTFDDAGRITAMSAYFDIAAVGAALAG